MRLVTVSNDSTFVKRLDIRGYNALTHSAYKHDAGHGHVRARSKCNYGAISQAFNASLTIPFT